MGVAASGPSRYSSETSLPPISVHRIHPTEQKEIRRVKRWPGGLGAPALRFPVVERIGPKKPGFFEKAGLLNIKLTPLLVFRPTPDSLVAPFVSCYG